MKRSTTLAKKSKPSPVWTGYLTFGLVSMPVSLIPGARSKRISFHLLHRLDHVRLKEQLYCPKDGQVVDRSGIVKGYEYRKDEFVIIEADELKKIEPNTAKTMEILEFVKANEVDPVYFESSYNLVPQEPGRRAYGLLSQTLKETDFFAIAKLTMHNCEYTVFLRPHKGGLMLHTMFYENEVQELESPHVEVRQAEIRAAHQLIDALANKFEPEKYHDTYEENLKKLIKAHLEGKEVAQVEKPKKPAPVTDLMSALKQGLAQVEGRKKPVALHARNRGASRMNAGGRKRVARNEAA